MNRSFPSLGGADLDWHSGPAPLSRRFGDVYYSSEDGLGEARHVFLAGNGLPERWRGRSLFTIGETGFGTGLNFLATWALWRATAARGTRLHYMSVEGFPLSRTELSRALEPWPELRTLAQALIDAYPTPHPGFHRIHVADDVYLTLLFGEARDQLARAEARVDAWFLDGFAPQKNPEMWRQEIFDEMGRLSAPEATVATFTVAGQVRRGLAQAGFCVDRAAGFGRKKEMLRGRFAGPNRSSRSKPWFQLPAAPASGTGRITIIGGGIAGTSLAHAFGRRGWAVRVREAQDGIARGASGNAAAVIVPRLTSLRSIEGRVHAACYLYAVRELRKAPLVGAWIDTPAPGALQLASTPALQSRLEAYRQNPPLPGDDMQCVCPEEASRLAGLALGSAGLYFARGGLVDPVVLCSELAGQSEIVTGHAAGFDLAAADELTAIAAGYRSVQFEALTWLPLRPVRGQVSLLPDTPALQKLRLPLSAGHYVTPALVQGHLAGASFKRLGPGTVTEDFTPSRAEHEDTLAGLQAFVPDYEPPDVARLSARVGIRAMTPDSLPVAGVIPDAAFYRTVYEDVYYGRGDRTYEPARYLPNMLCHTGLGARGFVTSMLCAELMASQLCGEVWPVERCVADALHPGRFLMRDIRRGQGVRAQN